MFLGWPAFEILPTLFCRAACFYLSPYYGATHRGAGQQGGTLQPAASKCSAGLGCKPLALLHLYFAQSSVLEAGQQSAFHLSLVLHKPGPFCIAWRTRWAQDGFSSPLNACLCSGKESRRVLHCNFSCRTSVVLVPSRAWGQDLSENLRLGGCFPLKVCICVLAAGWL